MKFTCIYKHLKNSARGVTMLEMMIVVVILSVMVSQLVPKYAQQMRRSNEASAKGTLAALRSSILVYFADNIGVDVSTLSALIPKYIEEIPTAKIGSYHPNSQSVVTRINYANWPDNGGWLYVTSDGVVFVNCTHTDTQSIRITNW